MQNQPTLTVRVTKYDTDCSDAEWKIVEPILRRQGTVGSPMKYDLCEIFNALRYIVRTGCQWRNLPKEFPPYGSTFYHFRKWTLNGTLEAANGSLVELDRLRMDRTANPSGLVLDSQTVKTADAREDKGYDGGKKIAGRKRHIVDDTVGHLLKVVVTAADVQDREGAKLAILALDASLRASIKNVWADGSYLGKDFLSFLHATFQGVQTQIAKTPASQIGFVPVPIRWVVERTFAWLGRYRRLSKDYERCTKSSEGMIYLASLSTLLRRLAPQA